MLDTDIRNDRSTIVGSPWPTRSNIVRPSIDPAQFERDGIQDLRDGLKTFLFAGHDTTACMLTWTLWEVMKCEDTRHKLYSEAKLLFPKDDTRPTYDELQNSLKFTFNVLRETLRLHSPVPVITREVVQTDEIGKIREEMSTSFGPQDSIDGLTRIQDILDTPTPQLGLGEGVDPWAFLPFINGIACSLHARPSDPCCQARETVLASTSRSLRYAFDSKYQSNRAMQSRIVLGLLFSRYRFSPAEGQDDKSHPYKIPITPLNGMCVVEQCTCASFAKSVTPALALIRAAGSCV
eukprot:746892-Hanusia_phi.AAC.5